MELYAAIYESEDDDLMKKVSVIRASGISISRGKAHIVGPLAARSQRLMSLDLFNCSIDDDVLRIIARCLKDRIQVSNTVIND